MLLNFCRSLYLNSARVMVVFFSRMVATLMMALKIGSGSGGLWLFLFSAGYVYLVLMSLGVRMAARTSRG